MTISEKTFKLLTLLVSISIVISVLRFWLRVTAVPSQIISTTICTWIDRILLHNFKIKFPWIHLLKARTEMKTIWFLQPCKTSLKHSKNYAIERLVHETLVYSFDNCHDVVHLDYLYDEYLCKKYIFCFLVQV